MLSHIPAFELQPLFLRGFQPFFFANRSRIPAFKRISLPFVYVFLRLGLRFYGDANYVFASCAFLLVILSVETISHSVIS